jgi:hypothetical protein
MKFGWKDEWVKILGKAAITFINVLKNMRKYIAIGALLTPWIYKVSILL